MDNFNMNGNGVRNRNGITYLHDKENSKSSNNGKIKRKNSISENVFKERESLLTQMFQIKEFRGVYNIFLSIFFNIVIYAAVSEYANHGVITLGIRHLIDVFGRPLLTISLLVSLHLSSIMAYGSFALWRKTRTFLRKYSDFLYVTYLIIHGILHIYIPVKIHAKEKLPVVSATIIVMEQVRLFMKLYAFHRDNIPRVLQRGSGGSFSSFVYYLYAPTLIYQDSYPRTKEIRWSFVFRNLMELGGCIMFYHLVHVLCGWSHLEKFGLEPLTIPQLINLLFFQMIPGLMGWLLGFFILLHTSQNIGAELLRFADRQFYKDWWNSNTYGSFYRNWNIPVHAFLYRYIYKEAVGFGFKSKVIPALSVFVVSSIVHEYILAYTLHFFLPVVLIFFGVFGMMLSFYQNPTSIGNIFIWWSLLTGNGLIHFFYMIEHFARINCPPAHGPFWDFVTPRSISCLKIAY